MNNSAEKGFPAADYIHVLEPICSASQYKTFRTAVTNLLDTAAKDEQWYARGVGPMRHFAVTSTHGNIKTLYTKYRIYFIILILKRFLLFILFKLLN